MHSSSAHFDTRAYALLYQYVFVSSGDVLCSFVTGKMQLQTAKQHENAVSLRVGLADLPPEVLESIIIQLDSFDRAAARATCRRLRGAANAAERIIQVNKHAPWSRPGC